MLQRTSKLTYSLIFIDIFIVFFMFSRNDNIDIDHLANAETIKNVRVKLNLLQVSDLFI